MIYGIADDVGSSVCQPITTATRSHHALNIPPIQSSVDTTNFLPLCTNGPKHLQTLTFHQLWFGCMGSLESVSQETRV